MSKQKRFREELPEDAQIWAKRINQCLIEDDMTQKELAEKSGVSEGTITGWLKGTEPKAIGLMKVADALGTTTDFILGNATWRRSHCDDVAISKITGLSDLMLTKVRNAYKTNEEILKLFNFVTASNEFACLMSTLYDFILRVNYIDDSDLIEKRNRRFKEQNIINPFIYSVGAADIMNVAMQRNFWAIIDLCLKNISFSVEVVDEIIDDLNNGGLGTEHGVIHKRRERKEATNNGNQN